MQDGFAVEDIKSLDDVIGCLPYIVLWNIFADFAMVLYFLL